ncbi:MAG: PASTA domain-containing protein [Spirochaetales bacterium]|nr:PASTA domain-containing protein [Spirochaetales bacterium]
MRDKRARFRLFAFMGGLGVIALVLVVYLFVIMVVSPSDAGEDVKPRPAVERGPIFDRNGEELALQPELYSVEAWMPHVEEPSETASLLAPILQVGRADLLLKLQSTSKSIVLKHQITPADSDKINALKKDDKLKGIYLKPKPGRIYPKRELGCHVVGHVNVDNVGLAGIEYTFDDDLSPKIPSAGGTVYGNQVVLTLDIKLQYFMDRLALEAYKDTEASSVMILAMGARTGEVLAYTSIPRFDPNEYATYSASDRMNRPALMAYEPGSTMKIFSLSSMLEAGAMTADDLFHCSGYYEKILPSGEEIKIKCLSAHGDVNAQRIIQHSCNAGAAYASDRIRARAFDNRLRLFGFGQKTGIDFSGESNGVFATPDRWSARSKPTIAFGQEISVSAVQMVTAATVFANDGVLLRPHVVLRVLSPDGRTVLKSYPRETVRRVLSPETARAMLDMMVTAVGPGGSAREANIEGVTVAAKTGTAQVIDPATGRYSEKDYVASIIGLFPAEKPEIILYVVVQNPRQGTYWGSRVAAPLFKEAGEEIIRYLDIPRAGEAIYTESARIRIPKPPVIVLGEKLPDLTGLPKRSLHVLGKAGLDVTINGQGYVVRQDPPPGTKIEKGMKIVLTLE